MLVVSHDDRLSLAASSLLHLFHPRPSANDTDDGVDDDDKDEDASSFDNDEMTTSQ